MRTSFLMSFAAAIMALPLAAQAAPDYTGSPYAELAALAITGQSGATLEVDTHNLQGLDTRSIAAFWSCEQGVPVGTKITYRSAYGDKPVLGTELAPSSGSCEILLQQLNASLQ